MPKLQQKETDSDTILDIPGYDIRHAIQTSDPQAVMESFKVHMSLFSLYSLYAIPSPTFQTTRPSTGSSPKPLRPSPGFSPHSLVNH